VLRKYRDNAVDYIANKDESKRTALEQSAEPRRLHAAREKRGFKNYDLAHKLKIEAIDRSLTKQGLTKDMTDARRFGQHIADKSKLPTHAQAKVKFEHELALIIAERAHNDPNVFAKDPDAVSKVLANFQNIEVLKQYPVAIEAMFSRCGQEVPLELRVDNVEMHEEVVAEEPHEEEITAPENDVQAEVDNNKEISERS